MPTSLIDPRIEVRPSHIEGQGLFATKPFAAGEMAMIWSGHILTNTRLAQVHLRNLYNSTQYSSAAVGEDLNILHTRGDPAGLCNHACDSNLWMADDLTLVARRDIASDEELTLDYALVSVAEDWQMPCACGSPLCRGTITGRDWLLPELQTRYAGHFSPFINERIKHLTRI